MRSSILRTILSALSAILLTISAAASDRDSVRAEDYYIEGIRCYCAGDYRSAESSLSRCLRLEPENDAAMYYLAMISMSRNETDRALSIIGISGKHMVPTGYCQSVFRLR